MAKVLVIGSGGREHAFAYTLCASPQVEKVYCSPGNAGTAATEKTENVTLEATEISNFALEKHIDLVVIGPEAPLADGLADELRAEGIVVLGPGAIAARLEASKAYATEFMQAEEIPLPPSHITYDVTTAMEAVEIFGAENAVIKADGLAGGKGVVLPDSTHEAETTLQKMFSGDYDGEGNTVVIQQRYHGPEVSAFVLSDGQRFTFIPLLAQDHKRLKAGDKGPNTGGMGAYAPLPESIINDHQIAKLHDIATKTIQGMADRGIPYRGILYIGAMLAEELGGDPIVIEYNARFGDPEAEVILPLLTKNNVDMYAFLYSVANGDAQKYSLPKELSGAAVTICLAAQGYPEQPQKGQPITGLGNTHPNVQVFHGGTKTDGEQIVTAGGRVLYVTGFGDTLSDALAAANSAIGPEAINFEGMQYRNDIGYRAMKK